MSNTNQKKSTKRTSEEDQLFYEMEADLPEDLSGLMIEGRRIQGHGLARSWLDDDGR